MHNLEHAVELDPRNFFTLQQIALSYLNLRRYPDMIAVLDRALAIKPDDVETRIVRAVVDLEWKADTRPLHRVIDEIGATNPAGLESIADTYFICALAERDASMAERALVALGENRFGVELREEIVFLGEFE